MLARGDLVEPVGETHDVHRGGSGDVLKVGLGQATITGLPQAEGTDALRERAFAPGAGRVLSFERVRRLTLARSQECVVLGLGTEGQVAGTGFGTGAAGADRATRRPNP